MSRVGLGLICHRPDQLNAPGNVLASDCAPQDNVVPRDGVDLAYGLFCNRTYCLPVLITFSK